MIRLYVTNVPVQDQQKALRFYTEKLGFIKKTDVPVGEYKWLTVVSPDEQNGVELLLEPMAFEPAKEYQHALKQAGIPWTSFMVDDLKKECEKMDKFINEKNGIDLMLVGIGMNGHIGFNEPGASFSNLSHVIELDEITKSVGQKYFNEKIELGKGMTLGFKHLLNAKKVFLMANGSKKAEVIKKTVEGPVTENFPASIMRRHENGFVLIDDQAASLLSKTH